MIMGATSYLGCLLMAIDYLILLCWVGTSLGSKVDEHDCILVVCYCQLGQFTHEGWIVNRMIRDAEAYEVNATCACASDKSCQMHINGRFLLVVAKAITPLLTMKQASAPD